MKIKQLCDQYALVVLGAALAILTLCAYLDQTLAAEPPPPVIANIGVNPYQQEAFVSDSSTCPSQQCMFTFTPVPLGQLLVITHISAQVGLADFVLLENGGTTLFVPKANSNSSYLGAQVTYYVNSGDTPNARIFYPNATDHTSLIVDLVGYLVPNQLALPSASTP
jgi:hypothetical protein